MSKFKLLFAWLLLWILSAPAKAEIVSTGTSLGLYDTLEQSFTLDEYEGNPFDVRIPVRFRHQSSGEIIKSTLFYNGGKQWKFRFTGVQLGAWTWQVVTELPLKGRRVGRLWVGAQNNPRIQGFLGHQGNRFTITNFRGQTKPYLFTVYMNMVEFFPNDGSIESPLLYTFPGEKMAAYLADAREHGANRVFLDFGEAGLWMDSESGLENPRLATFEALEQSIMQAHAAGMGVHIWQWKDQFRKATPNQLPGGINGPVDQRLQRYIAARLGALPGWTLTYGFDLHEWVSEEQLNEWADLLQSEMGWPHLLAARGYKLQAPNSLDSYDGFGRDVPLATTEYGPGSYTEVLQLMSSDLSRPHFLEERHSYLRPHHQLDMDGTRRLLWWTAMAGGVGEFIGFYHPKHRGAFVEYPYPEKQQFQLWRAFWNRYLTLDAQVCNQFSNAVGLCTKRHTVLYKTHAKTIKLELDKLSKRFNTDQVYVMALDTVSGERIKLGQRSSAMASFIAPRRSDWVLVISPQPIP